MQREGRRSLFLADRNCINDATHIETSEKAWTSGIGVGSAEQHFPFCAFTFTCAHTCFNCAAIAAALLRLKAPVALSENVHNELPRRGAGNGKRTWLSPGYEPKALPLMDMRRRLATPKELEQGQDEMKRADERMKKEALERGEEALEDEARGEAEMSMVSREELEKGTPAKTPSQSSVPKQLVPPTNPPPDPPALGNGGSPSDVDEKKTFTEKGDGMLQSPGVPKAMETPGGRSEGVVSATEFARSVQGPCFQMNS